jgi:nitrogen fixation/metabolism regulation signal transduction histidine kinase
MRTATQLVGSYAVLLVVQVLTSLVAIAMLGRMSPAIERILQENVYSVQAVEEMLVVLATPGPEDAAESAVYREALQRASSNVTEAEEPPVLATLRSAADGTMAGDPAARQQSAEALRELGRINREAMVRADEEAKRLGTAGAWAAAFLGFVGLLASFVSIARARRRFVAPVAAITRAVAQQETGDLHRRCIVPDGSAAELEKLGRFLNELLDHREHSVQAVHVVETVERSVALHLLDQMGEPVAVIDAFGELVVANRAAENLLAGPTGVELRESLRRARRSSETGDLPGIVRREQLGTTGATLCALGDVP